MSIVFATPCYGGQCTTEYLQSSLALEQVLTEQGIDHAWLFQTNESLVQRARNVLVARFMNDPALKAYQALMFIDADIRYQPEDVAKLWNLVVPEEGKKTYEVAVAAYRQKKEGAVLSAWETGERAKLVSLEGRETPFLVDYAGTGFMMIRRTAFEKIRDHLKYKDLPT